MYVHTERESLFVYVYNYKYGKDAKLWGYAQKFLVK
jgi:hypothetical protein